LGSQRNFRAYSFFVSVGIANSDEQQRSHSGSSGDGTNFAQPAGHSLLSLPALSPASS
jgi:hypothetical protein